MGVALGGLNLGVAQKLLNLVQASAAIDQQAGKAVPQVMDPDIRAHSWSQATPSMHWHTLALPFASWPPRPEAA